MALKTYVLGLCDLIKENVASSKFSPQAGFQIQKLFRVTFEAFKNSGKDFLSQKMLNVHS